MECNKCANYISYPTKSCKLKLLSKPCSFKELFVAPKEVKVEKKKQKKQKPDAKGYLS